MKNTSFQCLPSNYLVPKKFHCGLISTGNKQEVRNVNYPLPSDSSTCKNNVLPEDNPNDTWSSPYYEDAQISKPNKNKVIFKKCLTYKNKNNVSVRKASGPPVHVVCKSIQSEKFTQYQLITSNKLESFNYYPKEDNLKWCPIDFYDRPKQPFKRNSFVTVCFKEPYYKEQLLNDDSLKKEKSSSVLNINYTVISVTNQNIQIESVLDLRSNRSLGKLLRYNNDPQWEEILKLIESQLGVNLNKICVQVDMISRNK